MKTFAEIYAAVKPASPPEEWNPVEQRRIEKDVGRFHMPPDLILERMGLEPDGWTVAEKASIEAAIYPTPGDADAPETPAAG